MRFFCFNKHQQAVFYWLKLIVFAMVLNGYYQRIVFLLIIEETTPSLDKQPEKLEEARELGRMLDARLKGFAAAT